MGRDSVTQRQLRGSWQLLLFQCQALDFPGAQGKRDGSLDQRWQGWADERLLPPC